MCQLNKRKIVTVGDKHRPRILDTNIRDGRIHIFISAADQQIILVYHMNVQSVMLTQADRMCKEWIYFSHLWQSFVWNSMIKIMEALNGLIMNSEINKWS